MDEATGTASMLIDIPNGGRTIITGNLLMQGPNAENKRLITYGTEGLTNPVKEFYVINNTMVNERFNGEFIYIEPGTQLARVCNNLYTGAGTLVTGSADTAGNIHFADPVAAGLANPVQYDYHLLNSSPAIDGGIDPGFAGSISLMPESEYQHPCDSMPRMVINDPDVGAYEYVSGVNINYTGDLQKEVNVFPNPVQSGSEITFCLPDPEKNYEIDIISTKGKRMLSLTIPKGIQNYRLTRALQPGCWIIRVISENDHACFRQIVL